MADYNYLGLTAYIKASDENEEKLSVLAHAIDSLQSHVKPETFDKEKYKDIVNTEAYQHLYDHDYVCYPDPSELPMNTPEAYFRAAIEKVEIKDIPMFRLYIPTAAKNENAIKQYVYDALHPVLIALFGNDILSIKTKSQIEYKEFKDGEETVLVSTENKAAVPA